MQLQPDVHVEGKRLGVERILRLDQGPIIMMIENYRTGLIWRLMRRCPFIIDGLRRAGFRGGWLGI